MDASLAASEAYFGGKKLCMALTWKMRIPKKQRPSSLNQTWITASCAPRGYQCPEAWKSPTEMLPGPHGPCRASRTEGRSFASGVRIAASYLKQVKSWVRGLSYEVFGVTRGDRYPRSVPTRDTTTCLQCLHQSFWRRRCSGRFQEP